MMTGQTMGPRGPIEGPMDGTAISVVNLRKTYKDVVAVDGVSFDVPYGAIFAVIGPNGAGKTTTIETILGLRRPDSGQVRTLGLDPMRDHDELVRCVGTQLQEGTLPPRIIVREAFYLFESFYPDPWPAADLLARCGLTERAGAAYAKLSGGQKKRVQLGLALLGKPKLVVLDEPTSGMDPQARYNVWQLLRDYQHAGATILFTTHYMDEAQTQANLICMIDRGKVIALGPPAELLKQHRLHSCVKLNALRPNGWQAKIQALSGFVQLEYEGRYWLAYGDSAAFSTELQRQAEQSDGTLEVIETRRATIEDLYLLKTGRAYREE